MQKRMLVLVLLAACASPTGQTGVSGGGSNAGTYDVFISTSMSAPSISGSATLPQTLGTLSLGTPDSAGAFAGSFTINDDGGSGTVDGTITTGGSVTISHFGDPSLSPLQSVAFLEALMPSCDFSQAVSGAMSGAAQNGALALTGGLTLPCQWTTNDGTVVAPTVVTVQVSGSQE